MNTIHLTKRFDWIQENGNRYLLLNLYNTSIEEKIAAFYQLKHYGNDFPEFKNKSCLVIRYHGLNEDQRVLDHFLGYVENNTYFKKVAVYGDKTTYLVVGIKILITKYQKNIKLFKTKEHAVQWIQSDLF